MSDLSASVQALCERIGGVEAAVLLERTGIEVATWGEADFEAVAAELADLWKRASEAGAVCSSGAPRMLSLETPGRTWLVLPVGDDYLLGLATAGGVPPGRARFYAAEWVRAHREEFS